MKKIKLTPIKECTTTSAVILADNTILVDGVSIKGGKVAPQKDPLPLILSTGKHSPKGLIATTVQSGNATKQIFMFESGSYCERLVDYSSGLLPKSISDSGGYSAWLSQDDRIPTVYTGKEGVLAGRKLLSHPMGLLDITNPLEYSVIFDHIVATPDNSNGIADLDKFSQRVIDDEDNNFTFMSYREEGTITNSYPPNNIVSRVTVNGELVDSVPGAYRALPLVYREELKSSVQLHITKTSKYYTNTNDTNVALVEMDKDESWRLSLIVKDKNEDVKTSPYIFVMSDFRCMGNIKNLPLTLNATSSWSGTYAGPMTRFKPVIRTVSVSDTRTSVLLATPISMESPMAMAVINRFKVERHTYNHATQAFSATPIAIRDKETNQLLVVNDTIINNDGTFDGTRILSLPLNGHNQRAYSLHAVLTFTKRVQGRDYLIMVVCPTEDVLKENNANTCSMNTIQYVFEFSADDDTVAHLVHTDITVGFFGIEGTGYKTFVADNDYNNLYFPTNKGVVRGVFDVNSKVFNVAQSAYDVEAIALHLSPDNVLTFMDNSKNLYQVIPSTMDAISIDFEEHDLTYEDSNKTVFAVVNVVDIDGNRVETSVDLALDGPAMFRDNSMRTITITTNPVDNTRVPITITGYGDIHISPVEISK